MPTFPPISLLKPLSYLLLFMLLAACNFDDEFIITNDDEQEEDLLAAGEACEESDQCASDLCLPDIAICAATCSDGCSDSEVCMQGLCYPDDYCDEENDFGPGCAPLIPQCDPVCGDLATCQFDEDEQSICVCDEGLTMVDEECLPINPCAEDNGGCGDEEYFTCTNPEPGLALCAAVDHCAIDNGGCGEAERYECINQEGRLPLCRIIAACDIHIAATPIEDTYILEMAPSVALSHRSQLLINPAEKGFPSSFSHGTGISHGKSEILSKFDLSDIATDGTIVGAEIGMMAYGGFAYGMDGNVYHHVVSNDWSASEVTYNTRPTDLSGRLASWWLWYNHTPSEKWGRSTSPDIAPYIEEVLAGTDDLHISLRFESTGYRTHYYGMSYEEVEKRPYMNVIVRYCETPQVAPDAHASVASRASNTPQGNQDLVTDRDRNELYLRFDLSDIPLSADILGASLRLTAQNTETFAGDHQIDLRYTASDIWDESAITWANRPPAQDPILATTTAFPEDFIVDEEHQPLTLTFDTTELMNAVIARHQEAQSITFVLSSPGDAFEFANRFDADSTLHPVLELIYE